MIEECPVCVECRLVQTVGFVRNELLVGEAAAVYVEGSCLAEGTKGEAGKVSPLLYEGGVPAYYWKLGGRVARAFDVGKTYETRQTR